MTEMTVVQYAKSVNLSRHAVYKQIREGRLPKGVAAKEYLGRTVIRVSGKGEKPIV